MLVFAFGCEENVTEPSENSIVGKWKNYIEYSEDNALSYNVLVILEFFNDGTYILSENELPEHLKYHEEGKYTISDDIITIVNNECENVEGKYKFKFRDNGVEFKVIEKGCWKDSPWYYFYYDFDVELENL